MISSSLMVGLSKEVELVMCKTRNKNFKLDMHSTIMF